MAVRLAAGALGCAVFASLPVRAAQDNLTTVRAAVDRGDFKGAEAVIATALAQQATAAAQRSALEFERERMRRIRLDFRLPRSEMEARLRKAVPDLRDDELRAWDTPRLLEQLRIDGETRYFKSAVDNLFRIDAKAAARRATPLASSDGPLYRYAPYHAEVRKLALDSGRASVAPRRITVDYSLTVDADAVPAGETVRAWLPYPRAIAGQQEQLKLLASEPPQAQVAPESALQRTVYLEKTAHAGAATTFSIRYELVTYATYHAVDADKVVQASITPQLAPHLGERPPHIVFTPALRRFSRAIVGDEKNPYRIAQKLFAAVDAIPWATAREYSTIGNISDYALHAGHADCGQQTLLLMALLRLNGIPARWQSGWEFAERDFDERYFDTMHDWGWLYLAPYGWLPMDVTHGRLAGAPAELEGFYLGGLDGYRIAFNDDYSRDFVPPKQHFRSETVDLQRGEVEWKGGNLYFDQWDYRFTWQVAPAQSPAPPDQPAPDQGSSRQEPAPLHEL